MYFTLYILYITFDIYYIRFLFSIFFPQYNINDIHLMIYTNEALLHKIVNSNKYQEIVYIN